MKILLVLLVICVVAIYAEPPRFNRRFNVRAFARQEAAPPSGNGYNYAQPEQQPEEKPSDNGYHYPTPEYGLPDPDSQPPPAPEEPTTPEPESTTEEEDLNEVDTESETVETPQVEDAQADQLRRANLRQRGRKGRPLKLVALPETPVQYQRLVYYTPVQQSFARLEQQPIAVPVAIPQQGFSYSTQVFQQNW